MIKHHITKNCTNYTPRHKEKYKGEFPIICRSTWERQFCQWCDINENILSWASEPIAIQYSHPLKQRDARYYPDFLVKCRNKQGKTDIWLVEVKPFKETKQPTQSRGKSKKTLLYEQSSWIVNKAKWKAALRYCQLKSWKFKLITEKELFN